jgi:thioredoxin-related protein
MKNSSIYVILAIFVIPLAIYYFTQAPLQINSPAIASGNMPKVLQFMQQMCHDCKKIEKELIPLREEYAGKVYFQKIDVSVASPETQQLIQQHNVTVVPTLVFQDKNGKTCQRTEGYVPQAQLRSYLNQIQ